MGDEIANSTVSGNWFPYLWHRLVHLRKPKSGTAANLPSHNQPRLRAMGWSSFHVVDPIRLYHNHFHIHLAIAEYKTSGHIFISWWNWPNRFCLYPARTWSASTIEWGSLVLARRRRDSRWGRVQLHDRKRTTVQRLVHSWVGKWSYLLWIASTQQLHNFFIPS